MLRDGIAIAKARLQILPFACLRGSRKREGDADATLNPREKRKRRGRDMTTSRSLVAAHQGGPHETLAITHARFDWIGLRYVRRRPHARGDNRGRAVLRHAVVGSDVARCYAVHRAVQFWWPGGIGPRDRSGLRAVASYGHSKLDGCIG